MILKSSYNCWQCNCACERQSTKPIGDHSDFVVLSSWELLWPGNYKPFYLFLRLLRVFWGMWSMRPEGWCQTQSVQWQHSWVLSPLLGCTWCALRKAASGCEPEENITYSFGRKAKGPLQVHLKCMWPIAGTPQMHVVHCICIIKMHVIADI